MTGSGLKSFLLRLLFMGKAACITLLGFPGIASAAVNLYRYTNDQGVVEVSTKIPTKYVNNGYELVSLNGRVIEVVEPRMSPEEFDAHRGEMEAKRTKEADIRRVIALYASEQDVRLAEATKIKSIQNSIARARGDLSRLRVEKTKLEEQAAANERSGVATTGERIKYIKTLERRIDDRELEIVRREGDIESAKREFLVDLELFREVQMNQVGARY
ncbi:MAG: hypothetical protein O7H39_18890 [Gammaproteobacteria bacterium]|nr:hypothetical protein [Gammaproteobacteria bacterium]